ncbi:hybrid sensor histidine kinase/response regulator [Flammeovirgaceae bacterium SG7u.111]|nr:hybrid sensor histidine kinase/response regulator [Flammeovirgaceae bacterium SG7u.132]WPO36786.1 hybrid sensor histidine kinase/response regulator [Flammeovirgaceae bacterium SG7u.111]
MGTSKAPTILLADDEEANRDIIIHILSTAEDEYNFVTASDGKEMVEVALKENPDLIISDWEMPRMNGLEAMQELKKHEATENTPVIMCTGVMITPQNLKQALQAGAVDYIRKPIESIELLARIQSMLKLSASFRQIKAQKEELEKLNILKNRLLSVISHDVRSPINSLKGLISLFKNKLLSEEEMIKLTSKLSLQVDTISDFLENLLNWAKNQLTKADLERKKFHIQSSINSTVQLVTPLVKSKEITLKAALDGKDVVFADEEMLKIVLRNLLSNAIKFCQKGDNIHVFTSTTEEGVKVSIKDSGIGISNANLQKLFGAEHLSTKGTKDEIGTGLGLLLCKQIIESHGGTIGVESEEGKGSEFWFVLPPNS